MHRNRLTFPKIHQLAARATIVIGLLTVGALPFLPREHVITGTLGYDVAYIRMIPTPTGRKIRFVTNRLLRFGEVYWDTQSTAFNLTAGEFDLNDQDKSKSAGVLFPLASWR